MASARLLLTRSAWSLLAGLAPAVIRLRRIAAPGESDVIHAVGDSHVSLFSGADEMVDVWPRRRKDRHERFRTYRLGPVLAYRLVDLHTTSQGRERLLSVLAFGGIPRGGTVLLCFGEIDCRYHLPRRAELSGSPDAEVVRECVKRYAQVVREVGDLGFRVLVWGVPPSREQEIADQSPDYPRWGTTEERNRITLLFNRLLAAELEANGIPVVSLNDQLASVGPSEQGWYMDDVHLSVAVLPMAVEALDSALAQRRP